MTPTRDRTPTGPRWRTWGGLLLVVGVIVGIALTTGPGGLFDLEARRQDSERDVRRAAQELTRTEQAFFADFEPYDRQELASGSPAPDRGTLDAVWPRGKVLLRTPSFRWTAATAGRYLVTLQSEDGETLWTRTVSGTSLAWPSDAEALYRELSYVWTVAPEGKSEPQDRCAFRVEAEQEVVRWERRKEILAKRVRDEGVRQVLAAEVALRRGWVWEAWIQVGERLEHAPKDSYARALRGYIERLHGLTP